MVRYRYLGSATTDSNGQATINYTGQGLGDIDIVASTDDSSTISTESVQSDPFNIEDYEWIATALAFDKETYIEEVGDAIAINVALKDQYDKGIVGETVKLSTDENKFIDKAVTGAKNTDWTGDGVEVTVGASNTTLAIEGSEYYLANPYLKGDFEIVFDAVMSDTMRFAFVGGDKSTSIQANTTARYRIKRIDGVFTFERSTDSGATWSTISSRESDTLTTETCRFRFYNPIAEERSISYSDFRMIYYSEYTSNTNSNGVASFSISDLSSSGKYTFEASYGSLTAECEVINALFYDDGITDTASWDMVNINKSVSSSGKTFTSTSDNTTTRASMNPLDNSSAYDFEANPFIWEFDVIAVNGSVDVQFMQDSPRINKGHSLDSSYVSHTVKYVFDGESTIKEYIDDSTTASYTFTNAEFTLAMRIGFAFYRTGRSITVKNVRIYSSS